MNIYITRNCYSLFERYGAASVLSLQIWGKFGTIRCSLLDFIIWFLKDRYMYEQKYICIEWNAFFISVWCHQRKGRITDNDSRKSNEHLSSIVPPSTVYWLMSCNHWLSQKSRSYFRNTPFSVLMKHIMSFK